ncbi:MAG: PEP-CTERM sorting domain-containing protein [Gemmatimonadaceae bacterium]|jgi:hypothetical protein|nr:PEP-CTERM sorting domain-containing protein [Gemmatimonadaceae bacterium]
MPSSAASRVLLSLVLAGSMLHAQPAYRQANAELPAGLATLTASRTLWQGDATARGVASLQTQGFETIADGNPLTFGGVTMQLQSSSGGFSGLSNNDLITTEGIRVMSFVTTGATFVDFTFAQAINAFGVDITSIDFTSTSGSFEDNLGNTRNLGFAPVFAGASFFGVTNAQAFTSVRLSFTGSEILNFDNLQWGRATVIPEPSTVALFATGLIGLLGATRRRRRI